MFECDARGRFAWLSSVISPGVICLGVMSLGVMSLDSAHAQAIQLPEAVNRTLVSSPVLKARGFEVAAAEARLQQARFRPSPVLNVTVEDALGTGSLRGARSSEATVTLGWILERGVRQQIVNAARAGIDVSTVEIEIAQLDAAAETARRFIDCLVLQQRLGNAEQGVQFAGEAVNAVRRRVDASRAPAAELARAEAELARAELQREEYEHELLSAYYRLSAQWGERRPDFQSVDGTLSSLPVTDPFESLVARVDQNPDLVLFVSQARLAEAELNLARSRSRPSWRLSAGLRRIESTDDWALVGGINVPLRLGNRNQGRIGETQANLNRIEAASDAARVQMETELFVLYQELAHNIEIAELLESNVAPKFESALDDTRRAFELGRSSYLEYRDVQSELLDVAYEILDAYADTHRVAVEIERLIGESIAAPPVAN